MRFFALLEDGYMHSKLCGVVIAGTESSVSQSTSSGTQDTQGQSLASDTTQLSSTGRSNTGPSSSLESNSQFQSLVAVAGSLAALPTVSSR